MTTETRATVTNQNPAGSRIGVRALVQIGMLSAIAVVLMLFEIPLPFAPSFYEIDFSEVPVLVGCFVMGPVAGAAIEFVKILLNFLINGTVTAGVGELGNFLIGCAFCVPAGIIYRKNSSRKGAIIGMVTGTLYYDRDRMLYQRICAASGLCKGFPHADRCHCRNGNCSEWTY